MGKVNCQTVNIEGMRVPVEHVMIELRLPVDGLHAGEVGDPGFRVTSSDIYGLPCAENVEDWENTEASLRARLGSSVYDGLSDFEKEVLLRGTPLGHGRYTFLLKVESSGKIRGPEVTIADLKKLGKFSPRAHVYADPVSGDRVFTTYLADGEQLDYQSVLGTPVAFDAKKARGAAGRRGKHPGEVWDAARGNPAVLEMLLDGISPGSSNRTARIKGTRRANAQQMAWILQTPGADDCVHEVLARAHEVLGQWKTADDVARWNEEIANGADSRHFEQGFETYYNTQDKDLDSALRLLRGLADLTESDPGVLTGSMEGETPELRDALQTILRMSTQGLAAKNTHSDAPDLIAVAVALGYVSAQQGESIRVAAADSEFGRTDGSLCDKALSLCTEFGHDSHKMERLLRFMLAHREDYGRDTFRAVASTSCPEAAIKSVIDVLDPHDDVFNQDDVARGLREGLQGRARPRKNWVAAARNVNVSPEALEDMSPETLKHKSPETLEHMVDALAEECAAPTSDFKYLEDAVEVLHMIGDNPATSEDLYDKARRVRESLEPITERKKNEFVVSWEAERRSTATKHHSELYKKSEGTLFTGLRHLRAGERTRAAKFLKRELVEAALACSTDPEEIRALAAFAQTLPAPAPQSYNKPILLHRETQWWTVVEEDARGRCALGNPVTPPDVIQSFIAAGIINDKEGARQLLMDGPDCGWYDILSVARSYRRTVEDLENLLKAAQGLLSSARSVEFSRGGWSDALQALLEHPNATLEQKARATELLHQSGQSAEGKTDYVVRMSKGAGKFITPVGPGSGLPEHVIRPFPVTGPDGVTRLEMSPLPDAFTRESAGPRRLMRIDVRRSKFASNGHYDGDTVCFELLEGRVLLSCPWEDYDLLVKKAGPDADVDAFIRELLGKVKAGHATLVDADTKDDLDPEETLTQMVLAINVRSMNLANVLVDDDIKRHFGGDPIALGNEAAEYLRKNPGLADPEETIKRWKNAAEEYRTRKGVAAPRVPDSFFNEQLPVLRSLGLPVGRAAVSGSLVFVGIPGIEPKDIDILCDQETWHTYSRDPRAVWRTTKTGAKTFAIDGAEFFTDLPGMLSPAAPAVDAALATSEVRWGVPFLSVACMRDWKLRAGREKDRGHVRLVDEFLQHGGIVPGR